MPTLLHLEEENKLAICILIYIDKSDNLYGTKESYNHGLDIIDIDIDKSI